MRWAVARQPRRRGRSKSTSSTLMNTPGPIMPPDIPPGPIPVALDLDPIGFCPFGHDGRAVRAIKETERPRNGVRAGILHPE